MEADPLLSEPFFGGFDSGCLARNNHLLWAIVVGFYYIYTPLSQQLRGLFHIVEDGGHCAGYCFGNFGHQFTALAGYREERIAI